MNRHERRAAAAQRRRLLDRSDAIALTMDYLAHFAADTATGATLIMASGETLYIDADDARAMAGTTPARGRA